jgi:chemotaxis protein methyltransferase CheR
LSFFFRIPEQLDLAATHVGQRLSKAGGGDLVVVWSAGCATGEEPYSVAIALREHLGETACSRVQVLASDLNGRAIETARWGEYGAWSFRGVTEEIRERHFLRLDGGRFRVRSPIRSMVRFHHLAVQQHLELLAAGSVDVVLFRNVAIYLEDSAVQAIYGGFERVLAPGGLLLLAPADPSPRTLLFDRVIGDANALVRRRDHTSTPSAGSLGVAEWPGSDSERLPHARGIERADPRARALALGDRGRLDEALQVADRFVNNEPAGKDGYLLRGKLAFSARRYDQAVADLRRVVFMDSNDRLARYWYAQALRLGGRARQALAQIRELIRQLEGVPGTAVLEDGSTTADELMRAVRSWEESIA